jgi:hypothetical protein
MSVGLRRTDASFARVVRERVREGVERCTRAVDVRERRVARRRGVGE